VVLPLRLTAADHRGVPAGDQMGEHAGLSGDEWRTLQFAPFWMLAAVAGAYSGYDILEFEAFTRSVGLAAAAPGRLNRELMTSVATDLERLAAQFAADGRTIGSGLCAVAAILSKVPPEDAELLKTALVSEIGEGVARARGRFGRVVSDEDAKNLELVAEFLA
jgi:hypothetical protein